MVGIEQEIRDALFALQDPAYRDFNARLIPTVDKATVIGVRVPHVRALAKRLAAEKKDVAPFLDALPHRYFEENGVHTALLEGMRDFGDCMARTEQFLSFIDNWATCDTLSPRVFGRHKAALREKIPSWLASAHPYTVRFGIGMLMKWFLDDEFFPGCLDWVAAVRSDEYYVRMMQAWFVATALAKQYDATIPYLEQKKFDPWTHNKAIQKARESFRVSDGRKAYVQSLKV
ncbi:MAG: DNA alkylation repair protein [Treponemataceae bacterium]|nr:DNA alkylation repair protein [Treponemataceae bacterium]